LQECLYKYITVHLIKSYLVGRLADRNFPKLQNQVGTRKYSDILFLTLFLIKPVDIHKATYSLSFAYMGDALRSRTIRRGDFVDSLRVVKYSTLILDEGRTLNHK